MMPKGPSEKERSVDTIARAVLMAKIATGEEEDTRTDVSSAAAQLAQVATQEQEHSN